MPAICTKPLSVGEVITECKPLLHSVYTGFKGKVCDNCMERSDRLRRCGKCRQMFYCDKSCQTVDWIHHKNECQLFARFCLLIHMKSYLRLCLRLWLTIHFDKTFVTNRFPLFQGMDVSLNDIQSNTEGMAESEQLMEVFDKLISFYHMFGLPYDRKELFHWFALLWPKILCLKDPNNNMICDAFFIEVSTLDHSCAPNSYPNHYKFCLELRAIESIGLGQEITISYLSDLALDGQQRRDKLKTNFCIDCKCEKCEQNLDSDIDYQHFNGLKAQIFSNKCVLDFDSFESSINQFMAIENQIYGEFHPQKCLDLNNILRKCLEFEDSNHQFIQTLIEKFKANFKLFLKEEHELNKMFINELIHYYMKN